MMKKIVMKKFAAVFLSIAVTLLSSGCWDYTEYEHLALVSSMGVDFDKSSNQMTLTLEYLITGGGSAQQGNGGGGGGYSKSISETVKASGTTTAEALSKIQQAVGNRLFFPYLEIIVIDAEAAKYETGDIVGLLDRTPEIRDSVYLAVTADKAEKVLSIRQPNTNVSTGKTIHDLIEQSANSGMAFPVTVREFMENLVIEGKECVAPRVTAVSDGKSEDNQSSSGTSSSSSASGKSIQSGSSSGSGSSLEGQNPYAFLKPTAGYHKIDGIAAFKGKEFAGWLEGKECTGLEWILKNKIKPFESVKSATEQKTDLMYVFKITKSNCSINSQIVNEKPVITVNVSVQADLRKDTVTGSDNLDPDAVSKMEKKLSDNVKSEITVALDKAQKQLKTDIFCFGYDIYRQNPSLWHSTYAKKWDKLYPDIPVKINVTAKVSNTGTTIRKLQNK